MNWIEAFILGLVQGLTEFLPVSSSGRLQMAELLFHTEAESNLTFTFMVHGGTVLSALVVFRKDIAQLFTGFFRFEWNASTQYGVKILVSMIPVILVGLFFESAVEKLFGTGGLFVESMLMITALLLFFTHFTRDKGRGIVYWHAFIIGVAQAIAVVPGISRSGATIATGMFLRNKRAELARVLFSHDDHSSNRREYERHHGLFGKCTRSLIASGHSAYGVYHCLCNGSVCLQRHGKAGFEGQAYIFRNLLPGRRPCDRSFPLR